MTSPGPGSEKWMAVANVVRAHRFLRTGALVRVINPNRGNAGENVEAEGLSRSGRMVRTWVTRSYLGNFRVKWSPPGQQAWDVWTKEECAAWCARMDESAAAERAAASAPEPRQRPE